MKIKTSVKLLGTLAVEMGWVKETQIDEALIDQADSPQKLGEILIKKGWLSQYQLTELLEFHTQKVFKNDEINFGNLAIKNKFVSAEDVDFALQQQKGSNKLLGEILVENGLITLQKCNAILKTQKRFLLCEDLESSEALISCPECKSVYKIKEPDRPRKLRCKRCGIIFEMNIEAETIIHKINDPMDYENFTIQTKSPSKNQKSKSSSTGESSRLESDFNKLRSYLKETLPDSSVGLTKSSGLTFTTDERYIVGEEIERGGMGAILETKDLNINRNIVTKVLIHKGSKGKVLRFIKEAQINGQLEHPNIVPVHDLGMNDNGQVYFTMKWIKGETLGSIIGKIEKGDAEYQIKYSLLELIGIIQKVCDALAYAHSKGVIHRDLKPDNIMVGEFGEVQLMDWGLAKIIGKDESEIEDLNESISVTNDSDLAKTMAGYSIGTPQYMAPEQATGNPILMDERTDIYGIGGVLHTCISFSPPVVGKNIESVLYKVSRGNISALPKGTAPELVAMVKKAMALENDNRYQNIRLLSDDLTSFQSGHAVSVKHDSFIEVIKKLIQRNKPLSAGVLVGVLSLLIGLGLAVNQWQEALVQRDNAEKNFSLALDNEKKIYLERELGLEKLANEKLAQMRRRKSMSDISVNAAQLYLRNAKDINHRISNKNANDKNRQLFNAANSFRQALIHDYENADARDGLYETDLLLFNLSLWLKAFEQAETILSDIKVAGATKEELAELKKELNLAIGNKDKIIKKRIDFLMTDAAKLKRTVIHEAATKELISLKDDTTVELLIPYVKSSNHNCQKLAMDSLAWMKNSRVVVSILPFIKKTRPDGAKNPLDVQVSATIAICVLKPKDRGVFENLRVRIWNDPDNIGSHFYNRIKLFYESYAVMMFDENLDLIEPGIGADKGSWISKGLDYSEIGQFEKAKECFSKAIKIDPSHPRAYSDRAYSYYQLGAFEKSLKDYNKSISINPKIRSDYDNRGLVKCALKDFEGAMKDFNYSIKLEPINPRAYINRGVVKRTINDFKGAIEDYTKAIEFDGDELTAYINRGLTRFHMGKYEEAILDFNKSLELNPRFQRALTARGSAKLRLKNRDGAIEDFEKAIAINPKNVLAHFNLGFVKKSKGEMKGALKSLMNAIELNPKLIKGHIIIGSIKIRNGEVEEGIKYLDNAIRLNPKNWVPWYEKAFAAFILKRKVSFDAALKKMIELNGDKKVKAKLLKEAKTYMIITDGKKLEDQTLILPIDFFTRGYYRFLMNRDVDAEKDLNEAIRQDSKFGLRGGYSMLVKIANKSKQYKSMINYYKGWLAVSPNSPGIHNLLAWELLNCPDKKVRDPALAVTYSKKAVALSDSKIPGILDTLGFAYYSSKMYSEAVKAERKALQLISASGDAEIIKMYAEKLKKYEKLEAESSSK